MSKNKDSYEWLFRILIMLIILSSMIVSFMILGEKITGTPESIKNGSLESNRILSEKMKDIKEIYLNNNLSEQEKANQIMKYKKNAVVKDNVLYFNDNKKEDILAVGKSGIYLYTTSQNCESLFLKFNAYTIKDITSSFYLNEQRIGSQKDCKVYGVNKYNKLRLVFKKERSEDS